MKLTISNIDWDHDGKDEGRECPEALPSEIVIDDPMLLPHLLEDVNGEAANIAEWLSNEYGYCVCGFTTNVEGVSVS